MLVSSDLTITACERASLRFKALSKSNILRYTWKVWISDRNAIAETYKPFAAVSTKMLPYNSQHGRRYGNSFSQPNPAPSSDFEDFYSSQPSSSMAPHAEASQSSRRPRCPECGTRKMRLRAGQLICKRGHVQQHFRVEAAEDDEFLGDGVARKRRTTNVKKVRRLKSQHTPYYSEPETDVEQPDSDEEQLEEEQLRAHKRARQRSSRSRSVSGWSDEPDEHLTDSQDGAANDSDPPYSIRADSFFERPPRSRRSYTSAAEEGSGIDSEPGTYARASRRGVRRIWRTGVGLHGAFEGRFALLQCLQLILRLQLHKLRLLWGDKLPPETEAVARDLWTMFVSLLPVGHYPPEPLIAATFDWHTRNALSQEKAAEMFPNHATYDPESDIRSHRRRMLFNSYHHYMQRKRRNGEEVGESDDEVAAKECIDWIVGQDEQKRSRSEQSSEPDEDMVDPEDELAQLDPVFAEERRQQREQSQAQASDEGNVSDASASNLDKGKDKRKHIPPWATKHAVSKAQSDILHLAIAPTTLSIIYLSLHLLKVPILWKDLVRLISSYSLPYLNVVHQLPLPLTRFLNKDNVHHHHLDTDAVPSITTLHLHTLTLADLLNRTYGIDFGEGAVSGQLVRLVEGMLLPPTFYIATKRVLEMVGRGVGPSLLPTSSTSRRSGDDGVNTRLPGATQLQRVPKEFILMAALLVVIKMRYGLDGRERVEVPNSNEAVRGVSCAPQLEPWLAALDARKKRKLESVEAVPKLDPTEVEALRMTPDQIEAYASFAEENLILSNQIDLHEWRRLEPARRWANFVDFLPPSSLAPQPAPAPSSTTPPWAEFESDLRSIYRHHPAQPSPPNPPPTSLPAGAAYVVHEFLGHPSKRLSSDPTGLCRSPLYPRVIHHANEVVGMPTPQTPTAALDVLIDLKVNRGDRGVDANVKAWEAGYGIQAHLEVVERLLEEEVKGRARRLRRVFRKMEAGSNGGQGGSGGEESGEEEDDGDDEGDSDGQSNDEGLDDEEDEE